MTSASKGLVLAMKNEQWGRDYIRTRLLYEYDMTSWVAAGLLGHCCWSRGCPGPRQHVWIGSEEPFSIYS